MGAVYRAERIGIERAVAIKFLHGSIAGDRQFTKRFEREALAMSRLTHPHCVPVIDFGVWEQTPYVVMDFVEGRTLSDILAEGPLEPRRALRLAQQILAGLDHAHRQGIIHRDVKPANVIVSEYPGIGEHARVVDFGLAAMAPRRAQSDLTQTQIAIGTPTYMSPEQSRGDKCDPRADVYGVGVLLFRMLTGKRPFDAEDTVTMLLLHREAPIPALHSRAEGAAFSAKLERAVEKALAKERGRRFETALAFSQALAEVPEAQGIRQKSRSGIRWQKPVQTRTAVILASACAALIWFGVPKKPKSTASIKPDADVTVSEAVETAEAPAPIAVAATKPVEPETPPLVETPPVPQVELPPGVVFGPAPPPQKLIGPEPAPTPETPPASETSPIPVPDTTNTTDTTSVPISDAAIAELEELRRSEPKNASLPYLLGNLYAVRGEHRSAIKRYRMALNKSPSYRRSPLLHRNVIRALSPIETRPYARHMILKELKRASIPHLVRASNRDPDPAIREECLRLLQRIRQGS
jgi:serine/threonine-protein kinase